MIYHLFNVSVFENIVGDDLFVFLNLYNYTDTQSRSPELVLSVIIIWRIKWVVNEQLPVSKVNEKCSTWDIMSTNFE